MPEMRVLMANIDKLGQIEIDTYERNGGYKAIRKVIPSIQPADLTEMVKQSGLRGRGGAGFSTGSKWGFIPKDPNQPKYLVCNSDESEPGTFKDHLLIEKDPHQLIEGMILAAYAIGAHHAFIYCRGEFFKENAILKKAVDEAKKKATSAKTSSAQISHWKLWSIPGPERILPEKRRHSLIHLKDTALLHG